jgi:hypothetical protein
LEYGDTVQQHPETEGVMKSERGVLIAIARLAGRTPASVGASPKWTLIVQETRRNLYQLLKEKQLQGLYTEVLHYLTAVLKERSADQGETAKTTITEPPSNEEFREQGRRKWKISDDTDKRTNGQKHPPRE